MISHESDGSGETQRRNVALVVGGVLSVTLLLLSGVIGYGVLQMRSASTEAVQALQDAARYERLVYALNAQELHGREYQIEPSVTAWSRFELATRDTERAIAEVDEVGTAAETLAVDDLAGIQAQYVEAQQQVINFLATQDEAEALRIDATVADPLYYLLEAEVAHRLEIRRTAAASAADRLTETQKSVLLATGGVLLLAVLLVAVVWRLVGGFQRDLVAQVDANRYQATHDDLTGLPNRSALAPLLEAAVSAGPGAEPARAAVMLLDLDRFKEVNDTMGHSYGDELLVQVAGRLAGCLVPGQSVARLGGDEFAVVVPDLGPGDDGSSVAECLVDALRESFEVGGVWLDISASVGVAVAPDHGTAPGALLRQADVAMYRAKSQRLGFAVYQAEQDGADTDALGLFGDLRRALAAGDLEVAFQPIRDGAGDLERYEVLARWTHGQRGVVPPEVFVPVAESTGLVHRLTEQVLDLALGEVARWRRERGVIVPVSVNLSPTCLADLGLAPRVAGLLERHGLPVQALRLEITESIDLTEPGRAREVLASLSDLGVRLSLDEFGTGWSSLSRLRQLAVDEVKIDRSFVAGLAGRPDDACVVRSIVELAHGLGLRAVGEGIEDAESLALLRGFGCDLFQGHYLGAPVPASAIEAVESELVQLPVPTAGG